jgi:3-hydroxyisobutyrate dehydrogenase-like beta-hydroxyacid dehydrogenase
VVFGDKGVLSGLPKEAVHIPMSTITVDLSQRLANVHRAAGQHYLAAPVFGRPDTASASRLFIVAGGEMDIIARC